MSDIHLETSQTIFQIDLRNNISSKLIQDDIIIDNEFVDNENKVDIIVDNEFVIGDNNDLGDELSEVHIKSDILDIKNKIKKLYNYYCSTPLLILLALFLFFISILIYTDTNDISNDINVCYNERSNLINCDWKTSSQPQYDDNSFQWWIWSYTSAINIRDCNLYNECKSSCEIYNQCLLSYNITTPS